ncbi:DUF2531 family protein [Scandinavium sp. TWS1a]|uniref:HofP DNA utilization family protein n=1 Tax=Scandinavium tedordense TaxID=2926521 RepID=UPI00135CD638|nr:HofP DNA utilization family protein [Scandinavium tedordense]MCS2171171.1 DUF2531 family protein [Scandinavium tedordense]
MTDWRVLFMLSLPYLLGMRDPFQQVEDPCATSEQTRWHYHGSVSNGTLRTGIVQVPGGKWRRLNQGQRLENGWTVADVQPGYMDITTGMDCEPSQWRWMKEGTKHDSKDASGLIADDLRGIGQGKGGLPDGG